MCRLAWLFPPYRPYLLFQNGWILIGGACAFDQQAFLRRGGSDGCADMDLEPYSIDSHLAGRPILWAAWKPPHGSSWSGMQTRSSRPFPSKG
jgi:hypothetical protein